MHQGPLPPAGRPVKALDVPETSPASSGSPATAAMHHITDEMIAKSLPGLKAACERLSIEFDMETSSLVGNRPLEANSVKAYEKHYRGMHL